MILPDKKEMVGNKTELSFQSGWNACLKACKEVVNNPYNLVELILDLPLEIASEVMFIIDKKIGREENIVEQEQKEELVVLDKITFTDTLKECWGESLREETEWMFSEPEDWPIWFKKFYLIFYDLMQSKCVIKFGVPKPRNVLSVEDIKIVINKVLFASCTCNNGDGIICIGCFYKNDLATAIHALLKGEK